MIGRFKHALFIISFCMANGSIGTLAMEIESRENEHLLSNNRSTIIKKEKLSKSQLKEAKIVRSEKFRVRIERIDQKFTNFDSLGDNEKQKLLEYATEGRIKEWILKERFIRYALIEEDIVYSKETRDSLKRIQSMQYIRSKECNQSKNDIKNSKNTKSTQEQKPQKGLPKRKKLYGML